VSGLTSHESSLLLAYAICEIVAGNEGPGVAHARTLVELDQAGVSGDPTAIAQPARGARAPDLSEVITNRALDGVPDDAPRRAPDHRGWLTNRLADRRS
jgi:hypothetical protein